MSSPTSLRMFAFLVPLLLSIIAICVFMAIAFHLGKDFEGTTQYVMIGGVCVVGAIGAEIRKRLLAHAQELQLRNSAGQR